MGDARKAKGKPTGDEQARGRPRQPQTRARILLAAQQILRDHGALAVTVEGVAAASGVGKPSVYRYFSDRHELTLTALMANAQTPLDRTAPTEAKPKLRTSKSNVCAGVHTLLCAAILRLNSRAGRQMVSLVAAASDDSELAKAFRNHVIMGTRNTVRDALKQAQMQGQIVAKYDVEIGADALCGALFLRILMGHAQVNDEMVTELVRSIVTPALRAARR
jgi:AcrR family transcriptional regulator